MVEPPAEAVFTWTLSLPLGASLEDSRVNPSRIDGLYKLNIFLRVIVKDPFMIMYSFLCQWSKIIIPPAQVNLVYFHRALGYLL